MLEIFGIGVLIQGRDGIGKSETALKLLITGFLVPPRGSIDASIFAAISLIWGFYKLWEFYIKVENGEDGEFTYNGIFIKFKDVSNL